MSSESSEEILCHDMSLSHVFDCTNHQRHMNMSSCHTTLASPQQRSSLCESSSSSYGIAQPAMPYDESTFLHTDQRTTSNNNTSHNNITIRSNNNIYQQQQQQQSFNIYQQQQQHQQQQQQQQQQQLENFITSTSFFNLGSSHSSVTTGGQQQQQQSHLMDFDYPSDRFHHHHLPDHSTSSTTLFLQPDRFGTHPSASSPGVTSGGVNGGSRSGSPHHFATLSAGQHSPSNHSGSITTSLSRSSSFTTFSLVPPVTEHVSISPISSSSASSSTTTTTSSFHSVATSPCNSPFSASPLITPSVSIDEAGNLTLTHSFSTVSCDNETILPTNTLEQEHFSTSASTTATTTTAPAAAAADVIVADMIVSSSLVHTLPSSLTVTALYSSSSSISQPAADRSTDLHHPTLSVSHLTTSYDIPAAVTAPVVESAQQITVSASLSQSASDAPVCASSDDITSGGEDNHSQDDESTAPSNKLIYLQRYWSRKRRIRDPANGRYVKNGRGRGRKAQQVVDASINTSNDGDDDDDQRLVMLSAAVHDDNKSVQVQNTSSECGLHLDNSLLATLAPPLSTNQSSRQQQ